jgi:heterodisulfide reductase subunit A-like polyferredoxin
VHPLAEVQEITGEPGNFTVTLAKQPRYVDLSKCTGCGDCAKACPVVIKDEFNMGLAEGRAAYRLYPQAIPSAFSIMKASRAPCTRTCPSEINVQGYVQLIKVGKFAEALKLIMERVPFPGTLGRICPHPCEEKCRRQEMDEPISIMCLKRFAADKVDVSQISLPKAEPRKEKVAIIGGGPAGLTCAYHLTLRGYQTTVFEALPKPGGMLLVGIPAYRLPREVLEKEIDNILSLGVELKTNMALGRDFTLDGLFDQGYKAVFLGIGCHRGLPLGIPGEETEGVMQGVEFLRRHSLGLPLTVGKEVAVIGGGNVALDAACTARRYGANVTIVYRRSREEMPAHAWEIDQGLCEGVNIYYLVAPLKVLSENGRVTGMVVQKMELGPPDASGRRRPIPIPGSEFEMPFDMVIPAIGQASELDPLKDAGINFSRQGTIEVDPVTYMTSRLGVFAAGDAQTGPWIAVEAVGGGIEAAESIDRYLRDEDMVAGRIKGVDAEVRWRDIPKDRWGLPRETMVTIPPEVSSICFAEIAQGYTEEQALEEADRCINCGICSECMQCVAACLPGAIDHSQQPEIVDLNVGSVVLAPGFRAFNPDDYEKFRYASHPNVVTSLAFERILSAGGPYAGHLVRLSDHKEPKKIAWLQCVGSRDIQCEKGYCSAVCCMYAVKQAMIAKEHSKEPLDTAIFFMDMRTHGKEFEKYYWRAQDEVGVRFIRSRVHSIEPVPGTDDLTVKYWSEDGSLNTETFDLVVLSVGMVIPPDTVDMAKKLGIELSPNNFVNASCFDPVATSRPGVYTCGVFTGPKDIPQSVVEASAAAAASTRALAAARGTLLKKKEFPPETEVTGEPARIGVFVCNCGINIGGIADVPAIVEYTKTIPNVEYVQANLFSCSQDAQKQMADVIQEQKLNRVVVAACSPSTHQPIFQDMLRNAALNKYLFEMANIRNQCTWCHQTEREAATEKCKRLVNMAVAKARLLEPLEYITVDVTHKALVIGGGVAGMEASLALADQGYEVHLVEQQPFLGGQALNLHSTWKGEKVRPYVEGLIDKVEKHDKITTHLGSSVTEVHGVVGNFVSTLSSDGEGIHHGIIIFATGGEPYKPEGQFLYKQNPNVLLSLDLDREIAQDSERVKNAGAVAFIQCVGSRIPDRPYCSKVCCSHSVESALRLKEMNPEKDVYILYRDLRTYGERETLYERAREKGVLFFRFDLEDPPLVAEADGKIIIKVTDRALKRPIELTTDLLVLASAIVPNDNTPISELYKVPLSAEGFFNEAHAKIRPVDCATDGIFLAGLCHFPKSLDESIAQALASASRASTILSRDFLELESTVSHPIDENCDGCAFCVDVCPYKAITLLEYKTEAGSKKTVEVNEILCKGCGSCMATCPKQGIYIAGFTPAQLGAQVEAALGLI